MDLNSLLGSSTGDLGIGSLDTSAISSWFAMSMWVTVVLTVAIIAWYIDRAVR